MPTAAATLTKQNLEKFREEGFFILPGALPKADLEALRAECDKAVADVDAEMDKQGVESMGITHKRSRYFISNLWEKRERIRNFCFSPLMREITTATLGEEVYLFNEQFVVKCPEKGMHFGWHQDSGYIGKPHRPYMSCWIALDEVNAGSGTVFALTYKEAGTRVMQIHSHEAGTNDMIGYRGEEKGSPVVGPAGTILVFSSTVFHRSGSNTSPNIRRVYLPQYSAEPLANVERTKLWNYAEPFPGTLACPAALDSGRHGS